MSEQVANKSIERIQITWMAYRSRRVQPRFEKLPRLFAGNDVR
jgi:hypothetical protein